MARLRSPKALEQLAGHNKKVTTSTLKRPSSRSLNTFSIRMSTCRAVRRYLQRHSCESLETKPSPRRGMRWGSWQAPFSRLHCFVFHDSCQLFASLHLHVLKLESWCYHLNLAQACAPWGQVAENMFYARNKAWLEAFQSCCKFIISTANGWFGGPPGNPFWNANMIQHVHIGIIFHDHNTLLFEMIRFMEHDISWIVL